MLKRHPIQSYEAAIDLKSPLEGEKNNTVTGCQASLKKLCLCYYKGLRIQLLKYPSSDGSSVKEWKTPLKKGY